MRNGKFGNVLGELETAIMEIVWQADKPLSVADVCKILRKRRVIAYTTVQTVMVRLTNKGLLKRTSVNISKAHLFKPVYSKDTFLTRISRQIIKNLVTSFGDSAVAHFAQELENLPSDKKQELLKILKK